MHVIRVRNVHEALPEGIRHLKINGIKRESRNGPVLVAPTPVATVYSEPTEVVEFWTDRDSNPTFHLMEALWMLGGRNDVAFPTIFNSKFAQFSDDGQIFNGAYGYRWKKYFGVNQLAEICYALTVNPDDRRQVLGMWSPADDLSSGSKDVPCNTQAYFSRDREGRLNMTVCCRSNDIIWGAYGSNAVHFGLLLEYMAAKIGCPVGTYTQMSNNYHAYLKTFEPLEKLADQARDPGTSSHGWNPYCLNRFNRVPLISSDRETFDADLDLFLSEGPVPGMTSQFLRRVAGPLMQAYLAFSDKDDSLRFEKALQIVEACQAEDWKAAARSWYSRRRVTHMRKLSEETKE